MNQNLVIGNKGGIQKILAILLYICLNKLIKMLKKKPLIKLKIQVVFLLIPYYTKETEELLCGLRVIGYLL